MTTLFALILLLVLAAAVAGGCSLTTMVLDSVAEPVVTWTSVQDQRVGDGEVVSRSTAVLTGPPREERPVVDGDPARPKATAATRSAVASWGYDVPVVSRVGPGLAIPAESPFSQVAAGGEGSASLAAEAEGTGTTFLLPTSTPRTAGVGLADDGVNVVSSSGRTFVGTPRGTLYDIPEGWTSRVADNGRGIVFQRPGATGNADMIRIMEPTAKYPNGYVRYYNDLGQPLDLFGRPGPGSATHIPQDYQGPWPGWPGG